MSRFTNGTSPGVIRVNDEESKTVILAEEWEKWVDDCRKRGNDAARRTMCFVLLSGLVWAVVVAVTVWLAAYGLLPGQ